MALTGTEVDVSYMPEPGYRLKSVSWSGVTPTFVGDNTYRFTMGWSDVHFDFVFENDPTAEHSITVSHTPSEGGSAWANYSYAEAGTEVEVYYAPAPGYTILDAQCSGATLVDVGDFMYRFTMGTTNVSIVVRFTPE